MNTKQASTSSVLLAVVPDRQPAQVVVVPCAAVAVAPVLDLDVRDRGDLRDQVVRHRLGERVGAHEHGHALGVRGEVHGGLTGRVRAADHDDVLVRARARLAQRGAVVDALAVELVEAGAVELAVGDAGGDEHAVRAQQSAAGQLDQPAGALDVQLAASCTVSSSAPSRLAWSVARRAQVGAAQPGREAEVVLDPARHPGLAAGRFPLDHHRPEPSDAP
jgi:hypothetical protein